MKRTIVFTMLVLSLFVVVPMVSANALDGLHNNENNPAFIQCTHGYDGAMCHLTGNGLPRFTVFGDIQIPSRAGHYANENSVVNLIGIREKTSISPLGQQK